ncbi:MAG: hypothetical protein ABF632_07785 [Gluconobacter japonicus]|uniref:hypothetical protein n=1 Tax=Gluconobacter japonicus TaxID=376620 RepID=UPI0039E743E3
MSEDESKKRIVVVNCDKLSLDKPVYLCEGSWKHIRDDHKEVSLDHLERALRNPSKVVEHHVRPNNLIFEGHEKKEGSEHSIRVAVKTGCQDGNFVSTAFYSSDKLKGKQVYPLLEDGDDDKEL